jgi:2-polyprenyl-6-hydroxyphenyl methylase/3-demethylubiquinone-9 3-methyltransferase
MTPSAVPAAASVDAGEIAKFAAMAEEWWDPNGKFRPLHRFNPTRLQFIRKAATAHFARDPRAIRSFEGLTLLDIGCGGGLLSEPLARMGFTVLGADASDKNVAIAAAHAAGSGLPLSYRAVTAETLGHEGAQFDLVLNMEVVEHVADVAAFLQSCAQLIRPGGLTIVATLNRTMKSLALAKLGAEYVLRWLPKGTHDWNRFLKPLELKDMLEDTGLRVEALQGIAFDVARWEWKLSADSDVNYMILASKPRLSSPP